MHEEYGAASTAGGAHGHHHHHDDEDDDLGPGERSPDGLWLADHLELTSVGVDVGSAGSQVIFSRIKLRRAAERLSSRYIVTSRETVFQSPVMLTPYVSTHRIDADTVARFVEEQYRDAGVDPDGVDTGAVILTGEAIRRENARTLADRLAQSGGRFVCVTAGHHMEALLAAHGSGAAARSHDDCSRLLNIDVGGGTTKLAIVEHGRVLSTAAITLGGRLLVRGEDGRIVRFDAGGRDIARMLGWSLEIGDVVSDETMQTMADWMADRVVDAVWTRPVPEEIPGLYLTEPLPDPGHLDGVMVSGGVGEYVYGREDRDFGDLGRRFGNALGARLTRQGLPPLLASAERIRATVIGAAAYSVQISGNTIYLSAPDVLPLRNLPVLGPVWELPDADEEFAAEDVAEAIRMRRSRQTEDAPDDPLALAVRWRGNPSYGRLKALAEGIAAALRDRRGPVVLAFDGDVARLVGALLKDEEDFEPSVLAIDGIHLEEFDFIDVGRLLLPAGVVPVTVKSLVFPASVAIARGP